MYRNWGNKDVIALPSMRCHLKLESGLERLNYEDVDELWSFRCDGKKRLWCIKQMNICAILWWDPEHKVCPSIQNTPDRRKRLC